MRQRESVGLPSLSRVLYPCSVMHARSHCRGVVRRALKRAWPNTVKHFLNDRIQSPKPPVGSLPFHAKSMQERLTDGYRTETQ